MNKLLISIIIIMAAAPTALSAEVAVIEHPSVPVQDISKAQLLDLYMGDIREWDNGEPIVLIDLKPKTDIKQEDLLQKVASTPGAIGYVDKSLVTGDVITLRVIRSENN